jgi:hypothetical protein
MKQLYKIRVRKMGLYLALPALLLLAGSSLLPAQNLVTNPSFAGGSFSGWSTSCTVEVNPETTYGGPSSTIYVTEIDIERCINQQVCILPGLNYTFTFQGSRRIDATTPSNPGLQVKVTGMSSGTNYVNQQTTLGNSSWNLHNFSYTISIPAGSSDKKVNIQFNNYNNTNTYGIVITNIQLTVAASNTISLTGPVTTSVGSPNNFSVLNSPAASSYNWSFPGGGSPSTSAAKSPTGIAYSSMGAKTISMDLGNGTCTMATYTRTLSVSAVLPLQMTSFTGEVKENASLLTWVTADEVNNKYFIVERSSDGAQFDSIGTVPAASNASASTYTFHDSRLLSGANYYRLRQVDIDGISKYSKVISLENTDTMVSGKMQVYPNPALSVLNYTVTSSSADLANVQIYSLSGVLVLSGQQQLSAGLSQHSLNVSDLKNGSYFLKISGKQGTFQLVQVFTKI